MAGQAEHFLAGGDVPKPDDLVFPGRGDVAAVARERQHSEADRRRNGCSAQTCAVSGFQSLICPVSSAAATSDSLGENATALTLPEWLSVARSSKPCAFQIRAVESYDPETSIWPSGLKATEFIGRVCPLRVALHVRSFVSQSRTTMSSPAVASSVPSGLNATDRTEPSWPARFASRWCDATSQIETLGLAGLSRIQAGRGEIAPVGAERQRSNRGGVAFPAGEQTSGGTIPKLDRLPLAGVIAAGGQNFSIGRKRRGTRPRRRGRRARRAIEVDRGARFVGWCRRWRSRRWPLE